MPVVRVSEESKLKIDAISEKTGWTQEQILDWFMRNIDPTAVEFTIEGPSIVISKMPVRKKTSEVG